MFHHRFPTSTANVRNACHPFSTKNYFGDTQYVLIHNGYLHNSHSLQRDHQALGINYVSMQPDGSFNDSEALMWDLALTLQNRQPKPQAQGVAAWIMVERRNDEPVALHFGRNSNPLNMTLNAQGLSLASEGPGAPIDADTHYTYTYATGEIATEPLYVDDGYTYQSYNSGYVSAKGYETDRWGTMRPKELPESVYAESVEGGDVISTASDALLEANLDYPKAHGYAGKLVKQYSRRLADAEAIYDTMHHADEMAAAQDEMVEIGRKLQHWVEVQITLEDWAEQDATYKGTKLTEGQQYV